jgi:cytochrome c peroxidase
MAWLPAGFPPPPIPADNPLTPEKIELGRRLFYDPRLSGTGGTSCATCHQPELAFTDGRAQALGGLGEIHRRSTMSLVNVAYNASYTWADPTVRSLEEQMLRPMFQDDPVELGLAGRVPEVLQRLAADPELRAAFARAFPAELRAVTLSQVIRATASSTGGRRRSRPPRAAA